MAREVVAEKSVQGVGIETFYDGGEKAIYYHSDGTPTIAPLPASQYWVAYYKRKGFSLTPPIIELAKPKQGRPKGSKNKPKKQIRRK